MMKPSVRVAFMSVFTLLECLPRPEVTTRAISPRPSKFNVDEMFEDDLKSARRRAERAITEEGFLDVRNIKFPKPSIADNFDSEVRITWARRL